MSDRAVFAPPKALRGGVPVCFPQFSDMGPMAAQHGFARNTAFVVDAAARDNGDSKVTLLLDHPGDASFPHPFQLRVSVQVREADGALVQRLRVTNPPGAAGPLAFTAALHTYFRVTDIATASVTGLGPGGRFLDSTAGRVERTDGGAALRFDAEVDRIYLSPPGPVLAVVDGTARRRVAIRTDGLVDAVVWNPWAAKAAALADFGDEEYKHMVCVEPAAVAGGGGVAGLGVGEVWEGGQTLVVEEVEEGV
jgi:glucose-6-phosphate 1-epimerase